MSHQYFKVSALSRSVLSAYRQDPDKGIRMIHGGYVEQESPSMSIGIAFEILLLEGFHVFFQQYKLTKCSDFRLKESKVELKEIRDSGFIPIKEKMFKLLLEMRDAALNLPVGDTTFGEMLDSEHNVQKPVYGEISGIPCKALYDIEFPLTHQVFDLKTTWDVRSLFKFYRSGYKYGYDIQAGLYSLLYGSHNMPFLFVSTVHPIEAYFFEYSEIDVIKSYVKGLISEFFPVFVDSCFIKY